MADSTQHLLSLKVMRLSRPTFVLANPLPYEPTSGQLGEEALAAIAADEVTELGTPLPDIPTKNLPKGDPSLRLGEFGLSNFLALPSSFGNIYLGETFSSYLCINNESGAAVQEVGIKCELQTASQRFTLADTLATLSSPTFSNLPAGTLTPPRSPSAPARVSLLPTQSAEFMVHHEIKELGIHILVCSVHYTTPEKERKFFRKFYKFQVLNPLAVKTKVNTLQDGRVFLETQVQNVAGTPMYLERMRYEVNQLFEYDDLNTIIIPNDASVNPLAPNSISPNVASEPSLLDSTSTTPNSTSVFGPTSYLNPQDTHQYLYLLRPKTPNDPLARTTPTLGKLDMIWRTQLGQSGRLQTSQLSRKVPPLDPFEITVLSIPSIVKAEQPFTVTCRIRNNQPNDRLRITVQGVKSKMSSVLLKGVSERSVGVVEVGGSVDFELEFFPLLVGMHKITGLKVLEAISGTSRDVDSLADVYVAVGNVDR
ncbi:hypothetical protein HK097_009925 [Rhizophlyctis rosea]|uniref:Trafficking protein particle complex subunit 13 n=1 Tax=Rhizophlyctis rosea TaxID=64517 RepID=A0AAD5X596_9FUNG|nr:hypothetical protein HK097_009925 [Rhizophlyctis rosea]